MAMRNVGLMLDMKYELVWDYILNVATQKMSPQRPAPMEVDSVWSWSDEWGWVKQMGKNEREGKRASEEYEVDAVKGKGKSKGKGKICYNCREP